MISKSGLPRAASRRRTAAASGLFCSLLVLGMSGCEGSNLFAANDVQGSGGGRPSITEVTAPVSVGEGSTATVTVRAVGQRGITNIVFDLSGTINGQRIISVNTTAADTVSRSITIDIPAGAAGTSLQVDVSAVDPAGETSDVTRRTIQITAPGFDIAMAFDAAEPQSRRGAGPGV